MPHYNLANPFNLHHGWSFWQLVTAKLYPGVSNQRKKLIFLHDERVRSALYQILTALFVGWGIWYLVSNTAHNLEVRGMNTGFGFINTAAGFDTDFKLVEYIPGTGTYGRIFIIGALNTLLVSFLAIIATTILGFIVGVLRLSSNWLVARLALAYVEVVRNTPLLLQVIFWYIGVFTLLPKVKKSLDLSFGADVLVLNNRGLYGAWPVPGDLFWITLLTVIATIISIFFLRRWAQKRQDDEGKQFPKNMVSLGLFFIVPGIVFLATGSPLSWDIPTLKGFNFVGGFNLPPAFLALLVALVFYHVGHLAESVRAGILSVNKGQTEAAKAIGLRQNKINSLVIIPQAMRSIVPPMISLWMNVVKNSSLAVAIGYGDVVGLFMQTALNQAGYAVEMVGMTMGFFMFISLSISGLLNIYNKRVQLVER